MDELPKEVKKKYVDKVGIAYYGDTFTHYHRVGEITDLLPAFKEFYYAARVKDPNARLSVILQDFNSQICAPNNRMFHPYPGQIKVWRAKWDKDLMQQMQDKDLVILEKRNIHQVIKTRNDERALVAPDDNSLEAGVRTMAGELMNDALQMLRDDQELEEIYDTEDLMRRRAYIVNVFGYATRMVHGKANLMLKASQEQRENAGFIMNLIARASAGEMTDDELALLKGSYSKKSEDANAPNT